VPPVGPDPDDIDPDDPNTADDGLIRLYFVTGAMENGFYTFYVADASGYDMQPPMRARELYFGGTYGYGGTVTTRKLPVVYTASGQYATEWIIDAFGSKDAVAPFRPDTTVIGTERGLKIGEILNPNAKVLNEKSLWVKPDLKDGYIVIYDGNGGTVGGQASVVKMVTLGQTYTAAGVPAAARDGYTLSGWNTAADGSGAAVDLGNPVTASITLYAQWTANNLWIRIRDWFRRMWGNFDWSKLFQWPPSWWPANWPTSCDEINCKDCNLFELFKCEGLDIDLPSWLLPALGIGLPILGLGGLGIVAIGALPIITIIGAGIIGLILLPLAFMLPAVFPAIGALMPAWWPVWILPGRCNKGDDCDDPDCKTHGKKKQSAPEEEAAVAAEAEVDEEPFTEAVIAAAEEPEVEAEAAVEEEVDATPAEVIMPPKTGETMSAVLASLLLVSLVAGTGVLLRKKHEEEEA